MSLGVLFQHLVVVVLTCFAASTHAFNRYSSSFSRHINRRLQCGIMKNQVTDPQTCRETCAETLKCFSINTYRYDNGTQICELIQGSKDSYKNENCLEWKTGWEHDELEYTQSCPVDQKQCNPKYKKALPDGWYQLGSTAFKLFPEHLLWHKAVNACIEKGAVIAQIRNDEENQFVGLLQDKRKPGKPLPLSLRPLAHWKLDNTDENLELLGQTRFHKDIDGITTVLHLPGTADSYAETPSYDIRNTSFTIAFWVSPTFGGHVYSRWASQEKHFLVSIWRRDMRFCISTEHGIKCTEIHVPAYFNRWTHYTAVWNREKATGQLYVNGNHVYTKEYNETYTKLFPSTLSSAFDVGLKRKNKNEIKANLSQLYLFDQALTVKEAELVRDSFYMGNSAWIGLNDIDTEGQYKTPDSQVASYLNFAPGKVEPDVQDCVSVRAWDGGRMDMNHCQYTALPYICMKQV